LAAEIVHSELAMAASLVELDIDVGILRGFPSDGKGTYGDVEPR
jgi:hypothetical protein